MRFEFVMGMETMIERAWTAVAEHRVIRTRLCLLLVVAVVACSQPPADLSEAVEAGDTFGARAFLEGGADPDRPVVNGLTPLMRAANRDDPEMTSLLLEWGADITAGSAGLTAVHIAAGANASDALEVLLSAGADPAVRSAGGMNALDYAAELGAADVVEALVAAGARAGWAFTRGDSRPRLPTRRRPDTTCHRGSGWSCRRGQGLVCAGRRCRCALSCRPHSVAGRRVQRPDSGDGRNPARGRGRPFRNGSL